MHAFVKLWRVIREVCKLVEMIRLYNLILFLRKVYKLVERNNPFVKDYGVYDTKFA